MAFFLQFIVTIFGLLRFLIFARVLLSWFRPRNDNALIRFIVDVTQPILDLARRITPRAGMMDFSPVIALVALEVLQYIFVSLLTSNV